MPTIATKKPARKPPARSSRAKQPARLAPPPAKATSADLLRDLHDGTFDAAAANVDWGRIESAYKARASVRLS